MRKRQKFILTAVMLGGGLVGVYNMPFELRYALVALLTGLTWVLAAWALRDGLNGVEWVTVLLPPTLFTAGVGMYYVLLPKYLAVKIGIIVIYGVLQYFLLLTANIFSVAAIRTIALLRTAHVMGFVMTLVSGFLIFSTTLSFRLGWWWVGPLVTVTAWLLYLPAIWAIKLDEQLGWQTVMYTFWLGIGAGLMAIAVCFWPMNLSVAALFLTTYIYMTLGLVQHYLQDRLTKKMVWEYLVWGGVVAVTAMVKTWF